jgi:PKD repeat protein
LTNHAKAVSKFKLKITLKAKVSDPDGDSLEVSFYRVHNVTTNEVELLSVVKNVASGSFASCNFNLNFDTAFAWFVNVSDGRLFNLSNIWFFYTRNRPADNDPPVPIMGVSSTSITEGDSVTFDASDSYDPDPKGKIEFYRWNFGDNTSEIISVNPIHIFEKAGVYKTYLTVIDNFGTSAQTSVTINVEKDETGGNLKPVANISGPTSAKTGNTLTFDASDSYDPDDTDKIDNYLWDFGDGTTIEGKSEVTVQHTYNLVKTHTVTLTVTDDEGSSDTETFEVKIEKASSSSEGSPGFEIILLIISISLVLFYKKRKK